MTTIRRRLRRHWGRIFLALFSAGLLLSGLSDPSSAAADIGYRDFSYPSGTGSNSEPTGEKPESKLWWQDGSWWGSLWSSIGDAYHIYKFNKGSQSWEDTGVPIDTRSDTRGDALWDGQKLYVLSHVFGGKSAGGSSGSAPVHLYRYSYAAGTYSLDPGFPVTVASAEPETAVMEKDATGRLWITYVADKSVMVNHSLNGDDTFWDTPFVLPIAEANDLDSDDISSIISYKNHIGVMWSNQSSRPYTMYFAVHPASAAPNTTWTPVAAYAVSGDDHISLKSLEADSSGDVFAVVKTDQSSALIVTLVCQNNLNSCKDAADWDDYPVYTSSSEDPTRPILLIDEENRELYVFARTKDSSGNGAIRYKKSSLDSIQFADGLGTIVIQRESLTKINNPTSTKQNVNGTTGLLVLASDDLTHYYYHSYIELASGNAPVVSSFNPTSGVIGAEVLISGFNFASATGVAFNGTPAAFVIDSDSQIRATVPATAASGTISVTNVDGTGISLNDFVVIQPPSITSFTPSSGPEGSEVVIAGTGFAGTTVVAFNDLPAAFTVESNTQIRANVPAGATTGPIQITNPAGSDSSAVDFIVTEPVQYNLSVTSVGPGSIIVDPPGSVFNEGTVVTLTANPQAGYMFNGWSGDLSGATNPTLLVMDGDKMVTATFVEQGGEVIFQDVQSGGSSASDTVATDLPVAAVNGDLYLAAVSAKPHTPASAISGLGLTWTRLAVQCGGRDQTGVDVWIGQGTPTGDEPVTAQLVDTPSNAALSVSRFTNVNIADPISAIVTANTNGPDGGCSGGIDSSAYSIDVPVAVGGSTVYGAVALRHRDHIPGANYTERAEIHFGSGGDVAGLATVDQLVASPTTAPLDGTFGSDVDWAVVGLAIEPGGAEPAQYTLTTITSGSGNVTLDPPGGVYDVGTVVTLTAAADADWQFDGWSGDLSGATNPTTLTMDGDKSVTATFSELAPTQYSLTVTTSGSGNVTLDPPGGVYDVGTVVTLTAAADADWL